MKRRQDKGRLPPFVPLFKGTLDAAAWRAMSHGARSLYVCLKRRYSTNFNNNGNLYLSQRDAASELGSGTAQVGRWFHELEHYGFIVMTEPGCLGLDGKGKAPHWRITELGTLANPVPSRDFNRWNGVRFSSHWPGGDDKKPTRGEKVQKLSRKTGHPVPENRDTPVPENRDSQRGKCPGKPGHIRAPDCPGKPGHN